MSAKVSEKIIAARWLQAIVITCVMYLMMGMSQSESTSSNLSQWRSFHAAAASGLASRQADTARLVMGIPTLPFLLR